MIGTIIFWTNISLAVLLVIALPPIGIYTEKKDFNDGICPRCGDELKHFATDSQGGRGYCCDTCDYCTWVSWDTVDKEYRKNKEAEQND